MSKIWRFILIVLLLSLIGCAAKVDKTNLPFLGVNGTWQDFNPVSSSIPFSNIFKIAGNWRGGKFTVDENGYPTQLKKGQKASTWIYRHNDGHYPKGDYTLMWEGSGDILIENCDQQFFFSSEDEKKQVIPVNKVCDQALKFTILSTNENDHIQNIRLYLPGYDENSGIWSEYYIQDMADYGLTRFMWGSGAWCFTDTVINWEDRRHLSEYHWKGGDEAIGIPYEAMIELANKANNDLWVCVPHAVTQNFMRTLATMVRDNLNPNLRFWVEYSNEHWLDIDFFTIAPNDYLQDLIANNQDDPYYKGITVSELYARKSIELFEVFTEVFAEKNQVNRLVRAICGHASESHVLKETADEIDRLGKMDLVDVMGIGPYFRPESGDPDHHFQKALDQGWDAIFKSVHMQLDDMFDPNGIVGKEMYGNAAVAVQYNKPLVTYEAGQHYTTWTHVPHTIITPMNRRPEMYDVYIRFLDEWRKLPNAETNVLFLACCLASRDEAFGLKEYYNQDPSEAHKRRAVMDWLKEKE